MNHGLIVIGFVFLGIACLCAADVISSNIATNGAVFITSSIQDENRSYSASLVTTNKATVVKDQRFGNEMKTYLSAQSSGPMGIDEYSALLEKPDSKSQLCALLKWDQGRSTRLHEIGTTGLVSDGQYSSSRSNGDTGITGITNINGTGMITLNKKSWGNLTQKEREWIAGTMNISEYVSYGGDSDE